jgi:hypothetical protein
MGSVMFVHLSVCLSVCMYVGIEQLDSHLADFHEIGYPRISRKSVDKIEISLQFEKHNGYFTSRHT